MHGTPDEISSLDFPCGGFAPHGEFRARCEDHLLRWVNRGPFNEEAMRQFGLARKLAFERWCSDGRPMVGVVEWLDSALMSPGAFALYSRGFETFVGQHRPWRAVAWVAEPGLEGMDFMHDRFAKLFSHHGMPLRLFERLDEALSWSRAQLRRDG